MTHKLTVGKVKGGFTENFNRCDGETFFNKYLVPLSDFRALNPFDTTGHFISPLKTSKDLLVLFLGSVESHPWYGMD